MFHGTGTIREKRDDDGEISATAFSYLEVHPTTLFKNLINNLKNHLSFESSNGFSFWWIVIA
jgi:hypothetical protein